jgi:hypothetical protein
MNTFSVGGFAARRLPPITSSCRVEGYFMRSQTSSKATSESQLRTQINWQELPFLCLSTVAFTLGFLSLFISLRHVIGV